MHRLTSPILKLEKSVAASPFRIAPEKAEELFGYIGLNSVSVSLLDKSSGLSGFIFEVEPANKTITTSTATLELVWACVHLQLSYYKQYCEQLHTEKKELNQNTRNLRLARQLYDRSIDNLRNVEQLPWIDGTPEPGDKQSSGSSLEECFLCAIAWIFHHELAHLRLGHSSAITSRSLHEEKEADIAATEWILSEAPPRQLNKRAMSMTCAMLAIQQFTKPNKTEPNQTHPHTYVRIDYCLESIQLSTEHEIYRFVAMVMHCQLAAKGINVSSKGTFKDIYSDMLIHFSKL